MNNNKNFSVLGLGESDIDSLYGTKTNKSLTSSSYKSTEGPSNKKSEINNFKLFINSKATTKPQLSITSNLQFEKRTTNNLNNSTLKNPECNNAKLSARTVHKEEENSEFTSLNPSPRNKRNHLFIKSNDNSKSRSKSKGKFNLKEKEKILSKQKSSDYSSPEISNQKVCNQSISITKSLLLLKKGKGNNEVSTIDERNIYQSTVSFDNKIKEKAKVSFDIKNPLREKKGSVIFVLPGDNARSKNSSSNKKK